MEIISDCDPRTLAIAAESLFHFDRSAAMKVIFANLDSTNSPVRLATLRAMGQFGSRAHEALPKLIEALDDRDQNIQNAALEAIGKIDSGVHPPSAERLRARNK